MMVKTTNTELMSYIKTRGDISQVGKAQMPVTITMLKDTTIIEAPIQTCTHLRTFFPGDVGAPSCRLTNALSQDLRNESQTDMEVDATGHQKHGRQGR